MAQAHSLKLSELQTLLAVRGPLKASEASQRLGISQPTFSRLIRELPGALKFGLARNAQYALLRDVGQVPAEIPVYEVQESGKTLPLGNLYPIEPKTKFVFRSTPSSAEVFDALPYFLDTLYLSGFLGRLAASSYSRKNQPSMRLEDWSSNEHLQYLFYEGWDRPGNLLIGNEALENFRRQQIKDSALAKVSDRKTLYPSILNNIAAHGNAGSSAGGEQPKFTTSLVDRVTKRHLIVKYSPATNTPEGERVRDLLISEDLALKKLSASGIESSKSSVAEFKNQSFLEVERFDRIGTWGRRGYLSIGALNSEFSGAPANWSAMATALHKNEIIEPEDLENILKLESFGDLIRNTDRHMGNLSFFFENYRVGKLCPVYDMLPMAYMPRNSQVLSPPPRFAAPAANLERSWLWAYPLAAEYWSELSSNPDLSKGFRKICSENLKALTALRKLLIL